MKIKNHTEVENGHMNTVGEGEVGTNWEIRIAIYTLPCVYSLGTQAVKNVPTMQDTQVWSLGQEDPLEKGMATHSNILAWSIPWTEETVWATVHRVPKNWTQLCNWHGTPLQYSCLENPMDRGAWKAAVHGVVKSRTRLNDFPFTFHFHALEKEMASHSSVLVWRIPGTGEPGGLPFMGSHRVEHNWSD